MAAHHTKIKKEVLGEGISMKALKEFVKQRSVLDVEDRARMLRVRGGNRDENKLNREKVEEPTAKDSYGGLLICLAFSETWMAHGRISDTGLL